MAFFSSRSASTSVTNIDDRRIAADSSVLATEGAQLIYNDAAYVNSLTAASVDLGSKALDTASVFAGASLAQSSGTVNSLLEWTQNELAGKRAQLGEFADYLKAVATPNDPAQAKQFVIGAVVVAGVIVLAAAWSRKA
jgi:hypothetical protein